MPRYKSQDCEKLNNSNILYSYIFVVVVVVMQIINFKRNIKLMTVDQPTPLGCKNYSRK